VRVAVGAESEVRRGVTGLESVDIDQRLAVCIQRDLLADLESRVLLERPPDGTDPATLFPVGHARRQGAEMQRDRFEHAACRWQPPAPAQEHLTGDIGPGDLPPPSLAGGRLHGGPCALLTPVPEPTAPGVEQSAGPVPPARRRRAAPGVCWCVRGPPRTVRLA